MNFSLLLTVISSILFLTFFVVYNKKILQGSVKPNIVTWSLFSLITFINSLTYFFFTSDVLKSTLAFTDCFTCIVITSLIFFKGSYTPLTFLEKIIIGLVLISLSIWYVLDSALFANVLLQPAYILAFVPTLINTWKNPQSENALVWFMWAVSFTLSIVVVLIRWNNVWADFINPCIALILHSLVCVLALRKQSKIIGEAG